MKKYALLLCFGASNRVLTECNATNLQHAAEQLAPHCLATLDKDGYAKVGNTTYTVAEYYQPNLEAGA